MKHALVDNGIVKIISYVAEEGRGWHEVSDDVFPGFVSNGRGGFVAPPSLVLSEAEQALALTLTRKQLRMGLVMVGESETLIDDIIAKMPEGVEKKMAIVNWQDTTEFHRDHPLVVLWIPVIGFTPAQIDTMWIWAAAL